MPTVDEIYTQGDQLKGSGELEAAVAKFQEGLAIDETHALTHLALAMTLVKLNRFDEAVTHGERACALEPNDPLTYTALSVMYQRALAASGDMRFMKLAEDARDRANAISAQSPR